MSYRKEDFENPKKECDLVMKGGITSGVVYPFTIQELALEHRFVNVGGTSAGAIAAAIAAAAEYRRQHDASGEGFVALEDLVAYLADHLLDLFQPAPQHRKAFKILLNLVRQGKNPFSGVIPALRFAPKVGRLYKAYKLLPDTYFGLCPGSTQKGYKNPGLTDFLNERIEIVAGRMIPGGELPSAPLTFGDLNSAGIRLRTITTDLGGKHPAMLPFYDETWLFREQELDDLFPQNVMEQLVSKGEVDADRPEFRKLPRADEMPVLFAVRASLSFPVLLGALPLYRRDFTHRLSKEAQELPRRCWLSDGGIASNFPINLFDNPWPSRPTFGISLDQYSPSRNDPDPDKLEARVYLPRKAQEAILQKIDKEPTDPIGFLAAILDTARNWQDSLQTVLPGYRERIAHVALDSEEGGLNLEMQPRTIGRLASYGRLAGRRLSSEFDLTEHKWRRLLASYSAFEDAFEAMAPNFAGLKEVLQNHEGSYKARSPEQLEDFWKRLDTLNGVAESWSASPIRDNWGSGTMPRPRTFVKFSPREQAGRD